MGDLTDRVRDLSDEEVLALWTGFLSGYLVLPDRWSDSLTLIYCAEREAQQLPKVFVGPKNHPTRFITVGSVNPCGFAKQLQLVVESGAFVNRLAAAGLVFGALIEDCRAEDLARRLLAAAPGSEDSAPRVLTG